MLKLKTSAAALIASLALVVPTKAEQGGLSCSLSMPGNSLGSAYHISFDFNSMLYTMRTGAGLNQVVAQRKQFEVLMGFNGMTPVNNGIRLFLGMNPPYTLLTIDRQLNVTGSALSGGQARQVGNCRDDQFRGL